MWFHILLSVIAFNSAFLYTDQAGFLILGFPLPLIMLFLHKLPQNSYIKAGWWWGIAVFGIHFYWLFDVMMKHSQAAWWLCSLCYGVTVAYFSLFSALWLGATAMLMSIFIKQRDSLYIVLALFIITSIGYWFFLENWIFFPLGLGMGYPCINPLIPLTSYTWFLKLLMLYGLLCGGALHVNAPVLPIGYVPPVINRVKNTHVTWNCSSSVIGQKIFHELTNINQKECKLLVAPESMFFFPLNECSEVINSWNAIMNEDTHFFVGSVLSEKSNMFQSVFWLHRSLIMKVYVKKILMPFVEKTPEIWQKYLTLFKGIFLSNTAIAEFSDRVDIISSVPITDVFEIDDKMNKNICIIPKICLEFFLLGRAYFQKYQNPHKHNVVFFFANDSWFCPMFRSILYNLVVLKAHLIYLPVLYIGHFECRLIALNS